MRKILLDTSAYVAFKRGVPAAIEIIQYVPAIGINNVVLGELLSGFGLGNGAKEKQEELEHFLNSPRVTLLPIVAETASYYAKIHLTLKQKGLSIPSNDIWVAASALEHKLAVYSYEHHFAAIDGLVTGTTFVDFLKDGQH